MMYIFQEIAASTNEDKTLQLLTHLKEQLTFINKNPFAANENELVDFLEKHYPYKEKINAISRKDPLPGIKL